MSVSEIEEIRLSYVANENDNGSSYFIKVATNSLFRMKGERDVGSELERLGYDDRWIGHSSITYLIQDIQRTHMRTAEYLIIFAKRLASQSIDDYMREYIPNMFLDECAMVIKLPNIFLNRLAQGFAIAPGNVFGAMAIARDPAVAQVTWHEVRISFTAMYGFGMWNAMQFQCDSPMSLSSICTCVFLHAYGIFAPQDPGPICGWCVAHPKKSNSLASVHGLNVSLMGSIYPIHQQHVLHVFRRFYSAMEFRYPALEDRRRFWTAIENMLNIQKQKPNYIVNFVQFKAAIAALLDDSTDQNKTLNDLIVKINGYN